ncbi:MAG: hypothetical protein ABSB80_06460 [Methanoregula sp.]|uniref:hypothetical protein n=1 Tax=Methanoregula sp. TaxID=2052170 RepID=UPI003D0AA811
MQRSLFTTDSTDHLTRLFLARSRANRCRDDGPGGRDYGHEPIIVRNTGRHYYHIGIRSRSIKRERRKGVPRPGVFVACGSREGGSA